MFFTPQLKITPYGSGEVPGPDPVLPLGGTFPPLYAVNPLSYELIKGQSLLWGRESQRWAVGISASAGRLMGAAEPSCTMTYTQNLLLWPEDSMVKSTPANTAVT